VENAELKRKLEEPVFKYPWKGRTGGWQSINFLLTVKTVRLLLSLSIFVFSWQRIYNSSK